MLLTMVSGLLLRVVGIGLRGLALLIVNGPKWSILNKSSKDAGAAAVSEVLPYNASGSESGSIRGPQVVNVWSVPDPVAGSSTLLPTVPAAVAT